MSNETSKISELTSTSIIPENGLIPIVTVANETNTVDINTLRSTLWFEKAYATTTEGVAATKKDETFFTYADSTNTSVLGWRNQGGSSFSAVLDSNSNQVSLPAGNAVKSVSQIVLGVDSFDSLRTTKPLYEGQRVKLIGWNKGSNLGAGEFVGYLGAATDDGGVIAAGEGYYWERQLTDPILRPEMFGAKANGTNDDTAAILLTLNYAYANNLTCKFEGGTYYGTTVRINYPVSVEVVGSAFLNFNFIIQGAFVEAKNSVATTLTWAQVPVGTTSIAGNFSAFTAGGIVAIKLNDTSGGSAARGNEAGFDFSSISAASGTTLTLSTATRLAYQSPDIIEVNKGIAYTGTLAADTYSVAGNYTSLFAVGDVIRIENLDGTDSVEAKTFYFEYAKVASISTTAMTFKSRLQYSHVNPWLIKTGFIKSPKIIGKGRLKRLEIRLADTPIVDGLDIDRLIVGNTYDCTTMNINSRGVGEPSSVNHSFCFGRGRIHGLRAGGSISTTDNASCKLMSCPGMIVSDVLSDNTTSTGSQGDYGFFVDAYFTPYRCWNKNITVNNVIAELPRSSVTRAIWFYGMKNSTIKNLSGAQVFLQGSIDSVFESINTPDSGMEVRDLVRCRVSGVVNSLLWLGCFYSSLDVMIKSISTAASSLNIACRAGAGTTNPEDGTSYTVGLFNRFDVISNSQSSSAITFSIGNQTSFVIGNKCRDLSTVANSVVFGSNVTDPRMEGNFLVGPIQSSSAWAGVRFVGGFNLDGNYSMSAIKWNGQYVFLTSDGTLKRTLTKPTSDSPSDQIIIGP